MSAYYLEYGRHVARLRRHRRHRAYVPLSNTTSHDNHEKINSPVFFSFLYEYGAPLGGPLGRRGSAVLLTRPQAIPLAMISMRKSTHPFPFQSFRSVGLPLTAPWAAGAPLL